MWLSSGQGFVGSGPWDAARGILAVLCARDVACGQLLVAFRGLPTAGLFVLLCRGSSAGGLGWEMGKQKRMMVKRISVKKDVWKSKKEGVETGVGGRSEKTGNKLEDGAENGKKKKNRRKKTGGETGDFFGRKPTSQSNRG